MKRSSVVSKTMPVAVLGLLTCSMLTGCNSASVQSALPHVVATGLNGPEGLLVLADGSLLVSDDGTGGSNDFTVPDKNRQPQPGHDGDTARVVKVASDGAQSVIAHLLSVSAPMIAPSGAGHLAMAGGAIYIPNGMWNANYSGPQPAQAAALLRLNDTDSGVTEVANLYAFEAANNPDGVPAAQGGIESHPYGLAGSPDGQLYVADAAGNDLLKVNPGTGAISLVVSLAGQTTTGQQSVPTGVAVGQDGAVYVSLLSGYPFPNGGARIVKVEDGTVTSFANNLTLLTDVQFGPDGQLYAVSLGKSDVSLTPPYVPNSGSVIRLKADGSPEEVLSGLNFPTVIAFNPAGDAFIGSNGVGPTGSGQVVEYPKLTGYVGK